MPIELLPWAGAALLYLAFRAWYDNWRGPVTAAEIDDFLVRVADLPVGHVNDLDVLRRFLERDDGREFVMLNLVRVAPGETAHPATGAPVAARSLMDEYTRLFLPALLRRAGHPAVVAARAGGYVDAWGVEPDPGWNVVGFMRYRCRRDMMQLALDPRFRDAHPLKIAATAATFSFPTRTTLQLFVGPRLWVGLVLALAAAVGHLALLHL